MYTQKRPAHLRPPSPTGHEQSVVFLWDCRLRLPICEVVTLVHHHDVKDRCSALDPCLRRAACECSRQPTDLLAVHRDRSQSCRKASQADELPRRFGQARRREVEHGRGLARAAPESQADLHGLRARLRLRSSASTPVYPVRAGLDSLGVRVFTLRASSRRCGSSDRRKRLAAAQRSDASAKSRYHRQERGQQLARCRRSLDALRVDTHINDRNQRRLSVCPEASRWTGEIEDRVPLLIPRRMKDAPRRRAALHSGSAPTSGQCPNVLVRKT